MRRGATACSWSSGTARSSPSRTTRTAGKAELVLDLKRQLLGLALHPDFAHERLPVHREPDRAGRRPAADDAGVPAEGRPGDPPRGDPQSEHVIIEWPSLYHDGGCLAFGPDGYLYIAAGDGGGDRQRAGAGRPVELHPPDRRRPCRGGSSRTRSRATTRSSASPGPGPRSGPTACGSPGGSASTGPPATSGPATSARTSGRWSTWSSAGATTAGMSGRGTTRSSPGGSRARRRSCRRSSSTATPRPGRSPAASSTAARG